MKYSTFDQGDPSTGKGLEKVSRSSLRYYLYRIFCHNPTSADQDKGFAWLLLFWTVIGGALNSGLFYGSYGPLNIMLQKHFNISLYESSFICSLNSFFWLVSSPLTSVLTKKWSCRRVQIMGGCLIFIGFGGCAFTIKSWPVYLLYGIMAGLGASCCYTAVPGVLVHHFKELKYVAFAVSMFGNRAGGSAWASLSQLMFSSLGYSKTMGALGLITILNVVVGFFMTEQKSLEEDIEKRTLLESNTSPDSAIDNIENQPTVDELSAQTTAVDKVKVDDKSKGKVTEDGDTTVCLAEEGFSVRRELKILLSDWTVWCLLLNFGLWSINCHGFYFFINDYVVKHCGISKTVAALGVSFMGFGAITGSLLNIATSKFNFNRVILYSCMSSVMGTSTILMAFTNGKAMLLTLTFAYGIGSGLLTGNMYAVCLSFRGARLMNFLFGLGMFAQGFTALLTGPICSYLGTNVHYMAGIIFAGATGIAASLPLIPVIIKRHLSQRVIK